jgi:fatty-acyl-CoA synthase
MRNLSHARGPRDVPLLDDTIGAQLKKTVERFPDGEALVARHQAYRATWSELWEQVDRAARALLARGVRKGDRVGIWAPNRHEWVVTQLATARVGAILVTINPAYTDRERDYAVAKAGVGLLVDTAFIEHEWDAFLASGDRVPAAELARREASLRPNDPINIQFTSGTTGNPKGATLTHRNILNNAYFSTGITEYTARDRVCVPVPLYHTFGMVLGVLGPVAHGACIVLPSEAFKPEAVLAAVEAERCTSLYGVPTMFIAELAHPEFERYDLSSLRTGMMGGAPCPVELMRRVRSDMHMDRVTIVCGMTETSPLSTQTLPGDPVRKRIETVGRAHPHVEVKIVDPATGETVPRGVAGEQCTRGYSVMLGYWRDAEATAAAIDDDGWMHTGDLATMDDDGYVSIVGRIKDMIIRGGENISPREIEEFLHTLPGVAEAHVVGVPSDRYGEEVMAWVKPAAGATLTGEGLEAACRGTIARYKVPRHWRIVDGFPMTVTGKVQKYRLRELAALVVS